MLDLMESCLYLYKKIQNKTSGVKINATIVSRSANNAWFFFLTFCMDSEMHMCNMKVQFTAIANSII
ncbi:MAG: hypothetical protein COZ46_01940 [Verrucomicrobia bacterium CG_4_10_14_3_um_filter_43_23]|nr:MAG: hypothetical protein AUJ82_01955 [Verrucomicrobia bacterium CG1_02_43_26]PIP59659.1 MAG: hypothetical protein COX01_03545 [Verrucomicrobia bacterium CG22_combo_CG10-13_8_21_14_all_43_17]PIX58958.1 MAG: hypothetical protein COZ46_01940 [Verrucomicrobia bacterium CG_4_10_14_3_um_filter_43_23]PIY63103.1 MAG: hypothetical protein COY94_00290 [Verrucomicrobia bacterium CG_4_10_14_0_8_um_filter_43_34]PJA43610.1 MAG: hypothetical protein CO175_07215 [Verrucomicrobia bacterium CG_4_9_14_3_um_fi